MCHLVKARALMTWLKRAQPTVDRLVQKKLRMKRGCKRNDSSYGLLDRSMDLPKLQTRMKTSSYLHFYFCTHMDFIDYPVTSPRTKCLVLWVPEKFARAVPLSEVSVSSDSTAYCNTFHHE